MVAIMEERHLRGDIRDPQITTVPYDPDFEVFAAQDLGFTDSTAIWFWQTRPDGLAIIDYEEHHSENLQFYFELLRSKGYRYNTIWLPHDAKAKSLQTGRSTIEQYLRQETYGEDGERVQEFPARIAPKLSLQHGIDAVRFILPYCYMDKKKCAIGIEALRAYRRQYNEVTKAFTDKPLHDWSSHGSDAFRIFALVAREWVEKRGVRDVISSALGPLNYAFSLEQLFTEREVAKGKVIRSRARI
jgi:phage terminase large subunit